MVISGTLTLIEKMSCQRGNTDISMIQNPGSLSKSVARLETVETTTALGSPHKIIAVLGELEIVFHYP